MYLLQRGVVRTDWLQFVKQQSGERERLTEDSFTLSLRTGLELRMVALCLQSQTTSPPGVHVSAT